MIKTWLLKYLPMVGNHTLTIFFGMAVKYYLDNTYLQFLENDGVIMTNVQTDAFIYMLLSTTTVLYGKDVGSDQSQVPVS